LFKRCGDDERSRSMILAAEMAMVWWRPVGLEVEHRGGARGEAGVEDTVDRVEEEVERVRGRRRKRLASIITASYFGCPSTRQRLLHAMTAGTVVVSVSPKDLQRARCRCRYTLQGGSWVRCDGRSGLVHRLPPRFTGWKWNNDDDDGFSGSCRRSLP
jgi:hypothetical protein